jgi:DNA-binding IclR family transcriptional regulator
MGPKMRHGFTTVYSGAASHKEKALTANDKLLDVFDALGTDGPYLSLSEIMKLTGWPKATLSRVLRLAQRRGYLKLADGGEKYIAGLALLVLGHQALISSRIRSLGMPLLIPLSEAFEVAAHLAVPHWPHVLYLERVSPPRLHGTFSPPGRLAPFYATATGKALAAFQPANAIEDLLAAGRVPLTDRTKIDADMLRADLREIRERGWALDDGEMRVGIKCVAAPVRDENGNVAAAIGLSSTGAEELGDQTHIRPLLDAANTLAGLLGYA